MDDDDDDIPYDAPDEFLQQLASLYPDFGGPLPSLSSLLEDLGSPIVATSGVDSNVVGGTSTGAMASTMATTTTSVITTNVVADQLPPPPPPPQENVSLSMSVGVGGFDSGWVWGGQQYVGSTGLEFGQVGSGVGSGSGGGMFGAHNFQMPIYEPFPVWKLLEPTDPCYECTLLREVVHGNDFGHMTLLLHGGLCVFHHALLEIVDVSMAVTNHFYVDLSGYSSRVVKQFLKEYGDSRVREGYTLLRDSINEFFDVLCVGMTSNFGPFFTPPQSLNPDPAGMFQTGECSTSTYQPSPVPSTRPQVITSSGLVKTGIAAQRERTENLKLEDIAICFNLPIASASTELKLCTTALKKVCRKHGLSRWPYRKVKSAESSIAKLQRQLESQTGAVAERIRADILSIEQDRDKACQGWAGKVRRLEERIQRLHDKRSTQSGDQALKTLDEITRLFEKLNSYKRKIDGRGKAVVEDDWDDSTTTSSSSS